MILILENGERKLVSSLDGHDEATTIAEDVPAPPSWASVSDLGDDGLVLPAVLYSRIWDEVKEIRAQKKAAGVVIPGVGTVQTDDTSTQNITGLVVMAQVAIASAQPFNEPFTMADNTVVNFNASGMISMGVAVAQYVAAVYARARELRDALEAATTCAELEQIDIQAGWPA